MQAVWWLVMSNLTLVSQDEVMRLIDVPCCRIQSTHASGSTTHYMTVTGDQMLCHQVR